MDIRVTNSINFGLAASMEDLLQEGGRVMRGSDMETGGKQGLSFFLHKGALGNILYILRSLLLLLFFFSRIKALQ